MHYNLGSWYNKEILFAYFSKTTGRRTLLVAVSSPPPMEKS